MSLLLMKQKFDFYQYLHLPVGCLNVFFARYLNFTDRFCKNLRKRVLCFYYHLPDAKHFLFIYFPDPLFLK